MTGLPQRLRKFGLNGNESSRGFTLLEMLISLIIGTIIVGAVMGLISVSLQYRFRMKDKRQIQPILETAAQAILADPGRIADGSVTFGDFKGAPVVRVRSAPVDVGQKSGSTSKGDLYRVMLDYRGGHLEFSVLVPPS